MLSVRHIPRTQIVIPNKWISVVHDMVRLSSNSSSSDSSDSDSDLDNRPEQEIRKIANSNSNEGKKKDIDLYALLDHFVQKSPSKHVNMKINEKDKTKQIEDRIIRAAEMLNSSVGGDKEKIVSSLLFSISTLKNNKQTTKPISYPQKELIPKNEKENAFKNKTVKSRMRQENTKSKSSLQMERESISWKLLKLDEKKERPNESSIIKQLLQNQAQENQSSISKALLQNRSSVIEEPSRSPIEIRPTQPSIITQLLKEKRKSFTSKTESQKHHQEQSVIEQLKKQQTQSTDQHFTAKKSEQSSILKELLRENQKGMSQPPKLLEDHRKQEKEVSVIKTLLKHYQEQREATPEISGRQEKQKMIVDQPSISRMMLNNQYKLKRSKFESRRSKPQKHYMKREIGVSPLHWILFGDNTGEIEKRDQEDTSMYFEIFDKTNAIAPKTVELDTWNMCEDKYMKMITKHYPENAFQEMAQWTEEGKLWNFPIDNEQGMDEERSIHFSEHVFLEHHLVGWCPTKGPIRHFMELVCIGLSKNPYMTVQEKYDTIMWYRDFFADKNDLLKKLGLSEIEKNVEKQAQLAQ